MHRRPGHGRDGGLERPGDLAQRLALVVLTLAVVALADVPAAVGQVVALDTSPLGVKVREHVFGEPVTALELAPDGSGYRLHTRFVHGS